MHTLPGATPISRWHSEDIDEQSELLSGWQQEYRQLSCGKFAGKVVSVRGPRMTIVSEQTNQSLHQRVTAPAGSVVFGLVLNSAQGLHISQRAVDAHSMIVLEGGKTYDFRTEGSVELLGLSLDAELLNNHPGGRSDIVKRALGCGVVPLTPDASAMLRNFWMMVSHILHSQHSWPADMPLSLLTDSALGNVLLALNVSASEDMPTMPQSAQRQVRVVQQAIAFMRENLSSDFSIIEVCAAAHVSQRTLQYHFEHCLGVSPQQYLKAMRLNAARRILRLISKQETPAAGPRQPNIADIAAQCGYEHASRFAGDYRRQFGVLPSETLREGAQTLSVSA